MDRGGGAWISSVRRRVHVVNQLFRLRSTRSYGGRSKGVFGTLTYPHLIRPYSAYYGHLASHYGGPRCSPITCWCDKKHFQVPEPPIYNKMVGLPVLSVLTMGSLHTKPPPYGRSAMLGGHSTLNTVVLGGGMSKYQTPPNFGHHSCARSRQCSIGSITIT